ncbi:glutaredoxin [Cerasicoccus arenae]|uniref:Glutaredoxin domain-containing protein n=1 Tax=Cerasicoccus arenae TaxID=424488 RepID=A0A8J3D8F4_9BACT|nr:glutaredoxin [Cerasicoccus arenae]MBK1857454.1 glutaredoxin [Cerasicoccus arenae]GHB95119.1 hypothetical protein GCM10007047_08440 [Cerasicoccus arenae]
MKVIAWLKPYCGWSNGVRAIFKKYNIEFDDRDIINNPDIYAEMVEKSGQSLSPCVEINGVMLADVSGEEVENYMLSNQIVEASNAEADVPTNAPCTDEEHERMASKTMRFF